MPPEATATLRTAATISKFDYFLAHVAGPVFRSHADKGADDIARRAAELAHRLVEQSDIEQRRQS